MLWLSMCKVTRLYRIKAQTRMAFGRGQSVTSSWIRLFLAFILKQLKIDVNTSNNLSKFISETWPLWPHSGCVTQIGIIWTTRSCILDLDMDMADCAVWFADLLHNRLSTSDDYQWSEENVERFETSLRNFSQCSLVFRRYNFFCGTIVFYFRCSSFCPRFLFCVFQKHFIYLPFA